MFNLRSLLLLSFIYLSSCQTTAPMSAEQRRMLQIKVFSSASYNTVFRAFKTVMQDEGYIIKNQDFSGGLIVAESQKAVKAGAGAVALAILQGFSQSNSSNSNYKTGQTFSWSVNLEEIKKNAVEARIILRAEDMYSQGGRTGREVLEPAIYKNIFTKVNREIQRRKALKRN